MHMDNWEYTVISLEGMDVVKVCQSLRYNFQTINDKHYKLNI